MPTQESVVVSDDAGQLRPIAKVEAGWQDRDGYPSHVEAL